MHIKMQPRFGSVKMPAIKVNFRPLFLYMVTRVLKRFGDEFNSCRSIPIKKRERERER